MSAIVIGDAAPIATTGPVLGVAVAGIAPPPEPPALDRLQRQCAWLRSLPDGWADGSSRAPADAAPSRRPDPALVDRLEAALAALIRCGARCPYLHPTGEGGVEVDWVDCADFEARP